ncbi:hypothetical protein RQP46_008236 [Phenoliferia psychrophenolica]
MFAFRSLCTVAALVSTAHATAAPVDVGTAKDFVILAQSGISTTPNSNITGHMGVSPAPASYITGFSMAMASDDATALSSQVLGNIFAANFGFSTPQRLTQATNDGRTAYNTAMGQPNPDFFNYQAGGLDTLTLAPGLYKWTTDVAIKGPVTLLGGPDDVWVFQISGQLTSAVASVVSMAGGAKSTNVYWATASGTSLGAVSQNVGTFLSQTNIILKTGSSVVGQLIAQTAVVLQQATVNSLTDDSSYQNFAPSSAQPSSTQAPYVASSTVSDAGFRSAYSAPASSSAVSSPAATSAAAVPTSTSEAAVPTSTSEVAAAPASSSAAAAQATPANGNTQGSDANAHGNNPNANANAQGSQGNGNGNQAAAASPSASSRGAPVYGGYSSVSATTSA